MRSRLEHYNLIMLAIGFAGMLGIYVGCKTPPIPGPIPDPFPTTTTTTVPPVAGEYPATVGLAGTSASWASLKQIATITKCNFDGKNLDIAWTYSEPWTDQGDGYCDKVVCFFDPRSGRAAYLEYSGNAWTDHSFNSIGDNLANGHGDLALVSGDKIGFFLAGWKNATQRSDIFWTTIP